ncbi:MAG: mucoidy inhibitor MuiA family protein [Deltaproteobacteria bacterium]|nr:mucoidy inhibitor MuiA family protein [Deltaproteobacteria bacterium]
MTTTSLTAALITHHPALDETRVKVALPVIKVTLLEDRAQVRREAAVALQAGRNRLALWGLAPVAQDVSLRVDVQGGAKVVDARVRRAMRVGHAEKPEAAAALEQQLLALERQHRDAAEQRQRAATRAAVVDDMMHKAMAEVPEDAGWGLGHPKTWEDTFESLSSTSRALLADERVQRATMERLAEEAAHVVTKRSLIDRPDHRLECVAEIDLDAAAAGTVTLGLEYVVPNALWRPFHTAQLMARALRFTCQAAVWQNTGEDWTDAQLVFSTARSSLGHEPPKLTDDKLQAKKREQRVVVEAREVAVQNAGLGRGGGGGPPPGGVQLPGVDDGGDVQNLRALHPVTVPSDGRPSFVPIFTFESEATSSLVSMPELDGKALFKSVQTHTGKHPVLAGPVELLRTSGFVGTTRTLYVAPGERFALGFGPDSDVRVQRTVDTTEEVDEVDKWRRKTHAVSIFLSNLGAEDKTLEVSERIPVSEIEHVEVTLVADKTSGAPELNEHGIVTWKMTLPGASRMRLSLTYVMAFAPGVQGM